MNKDSIMDLLIENGFKRVKAAVPTSHHGFQVVGYKRKRGLSIIAGETMYSSPRTVHDHYTEVEVALLVNGELRYCASDSPFFSGDVEGYVDERRLGRIAASIQDLKLEKARR